MKEDGQAIDGLYAVGNCSAAVLPTIRARAQHWGLQ